MSNRIDWVNRLGKWRSFFVGWQLGTRPKGDPESDALRDHRDATTMLRAENNALLALLVGKGILSLDEFTEQLNDECGHLCEAYSDRFPGVRATDAGLEFTPEAVATMKRMNFKP